MCLRLFKSWPAPPVRVNLNPFDADNKLVIIFVIEAGKMNNERLHLSAPLHAERNIPEMPVFPTRLTFKVLVFLPLWDFLVSSRAPQ